MATPKLIDTDGLAVFKDECDKAYLEKVTLPDLTPYMKKTADSDLLMAGQSIIFPGATFVSEPVNGVGSLKIKAKNSRGVFVEGYLMMNGATVATEDYVNTAIPTKTSQLTNDSSYVTETEVDAKIPTKTSQLTNDSGYITKSEVSGVVKSVNNIVPDSNGNVTITVSGGTGGNITIDSALSSTSTNPVQNRVVQQEFTSVRAAIPTKVSQLTNDAGYLTQHQSLDGYVKTSGQNVWRAQQTFNLATLGYEQYTTPNSSTSSVSPSTSVASYYATGAFTLNLATLSALLGSNQSTVFSAYITAGGDYALSITNGGTVKYIGEASDVAITSAGLLLNILMTKDSYGSLTSIVQANKLT